VGGIPIHTPAGVGVTESGLPVALHANAI